MIAVPQIPHIKNGETLNFKNVNHIIKRIEYAVDLFDEIKLQEKIPGNIVGVSQDGFTVGEIRNRNAYLYNGISFSYVNTKFGFSSPTTIRENFILYKNGVIYSIANGKTEIIGLPNANDFQGNLIVGSVQIGVGLDRGYIYNRKSKTTTIISHPDYDRTTFLSIDDKIILGYASKFLAIPNKTNQIAFLYKVGSNPSKKSSYKILYEYKYLPNKFPFGAFPIRIRDGILVGYYRNGNTFNAGGTFGPQEKAYYSFIGSAIQYLELMDDSPSCTSFASGISKNFIVGSKLNYASRKITSFCYNIQKNKELVLIDPNRSQTYAFDIDIQ